MNSLLCHLNKNIKELKENGLYKSERVLTSSQSSCINVLNGGKVINFCANNYLGLANDKEIINVAKSALNKYGYGMASVRFICGTHFLHKELEKKVSNFLGTEDTILYSSCFDANGGFFETVLQSEDAVLSDELNHASIIDGIRLCKAKRYRYKNNDSVDLEEKLQKASDEGARFKLVVTDGVFSMDGIIADLKPICNIAKKYNAIVMVDDSHGVGVLGETGSGTAEFLNVSDLVDVYTGTFGKALGGAFGGYVSGRGEIIDWLRNRSRPYLFSNSIPPMVAAASIFAIDIMRSERGVKLRELLFNNTCYFRDKIKSVGYKIVESVHPIVPIIVGDAELANRLANMLYEKGIYVVGFSYPVVPSGMARVRVQLSASHTVQDLDYAVSAFAEVGKFLGII